MNKFIEIYEKSYQDICDEEGVCRYNGYMNGNALALYVDNKYSINAADNSSAHEAMINILEHKKSINNEKIY